MGSKWGFALLLLSTRTKKETTRSSVVQWLHLFLSVCENPNPRNSFTFIKYWKLWLNNRDWYSINIVQLQCLNLAVIISKSTVSILVNWFSEPDFENPPKFPGLQGFNETAWIQFHGFYSSTSLWRCLNLSSGSYWGVWNCSNYPICAIMWDHVEPLHDCWTKTNAKTNVAILLGCHTITSGINQFPKVWMDSDKGSCLDSWCVKGVSIFVPRLAMTQWVVRKLLVFQSALQHTSKDRGTRGYTWPLGQDGRIKEYQTNKPLTAAATESHKIFCHTSFLSMLRRTCAQYKYRTKTSSTLKQQESSSAALSLSTHWMC